MPAQDEVEDEEECGGPLRASIWERMCAALPPAERDEARRLIGNRIVEQSVDLRNEVQSLREILHDFQQQNQAVREQLRRKPPLPEHPARQLLEQQIVLLINSVKQSSSKTAQLCLSPKGKADQRVQEYVLKRQASRGALLAPASEGSAACSGGGGGGGGGAEPASAAALALRPQLASASPRTSGSPAATSRRPGTASSGLSSSSAPADVLLQAADGPLSLFRLDKVVADVRAAIKDECAQLLEETERIQALLEMEHDEIVEEKNAAVPPALEDMREYTAKLEKTWLMEEQGSAMLLKASQPSELLLEGRKREQARAASSRAESEGLKGAGSSGSQERSRASGSRHARTEKVAAVAATAAATRTTMSEPSVGGAANSRAVPSAELAPLTPSSRAAQRLRERVHSARAPPAIGEPERASC
jgi:hypothetical protein